jgi:hypothetical protein
MPQEGGRAIASTGGVRVIMRAYFSSYLLWTAERATFDAGRIESAHEGSSKFDIEHRGYVLSALLASAAFLEAVVNELYQDAHDSHGVSGDGYIAPLTEEARQTMAQLWRATDEGSRMRPLDKYQLLLTFAGRQPLDAGAQPYQDAHLVIQLRNAVAHYQPEDLSVDAPHAMEKRLKGKFEDNRLMAGSGNPWWPDHSLGHGCAAWAVDSAIALTDRVTGEVGIRANYARLRADNWEGLGGPPDVPPSSGEDLGRYRRC